MLVPGSEYAETVPYYACHPKDIPRKAVNGDCFVSIVTA